MTYHMKNMTNSLLQGGVTNLKRYSIRVRLKLGLGGLTMKNMTNYFATCISD